MSTWTVGVLSASAANQPYDCSDYARFEDHGWPACILAEDGVWEDYNTIMHTVNDNVSYGHIDPVFEADIVKGVAGFLASQLEPLPEPATLSLLVLASVFLIRRRRASAAAGGRLHSFPAVYVGISAPTKPFTAGKDSRPGTRHRGARLLRPSGTSQTTAPGFDPRYLVFDP